MRVDAGAIIDRYYADNELLRGLLLKHSVSVRDKALEVLDRHPEIVADRDLVHDGAMLHDVVSSGGKRSVFGIGRFAVLASCTFPWMKAIVEPAAIPEVLLEVIDGNDTHLTREAVIDLLQDVILGFGDQLFDVPCIHGVNGRVRLIEFPFTHIQGVFLVVGDWSLDTLFPDKVFES